MTKKKKKMRTELHIVKPSGEASELKRGDVSYQSTQIEELTTKLKKARKRIKKLEENLKDATASYDMLVEKHVALEKKVETLDTRTSRMGMALRECMKKLGVGRPL